MSTFGQSSEGEHLRCLLFSAEQAEKADKPFEAMDWYLRLDLFLEAEAEQNVENGWHCKGLQAHCRAKYLSLSSHPSKVQQREEARSHLHTSAAENNSPSFGASEADSLKSAMQQDDMLSLLLSLDIQQSLGEKANMLQPSQADASATIHINQTSKSLNRSSGPEGWNGKRRRNFSPPHYDREEQHLPSSAPAANGAQYEARTGGYQQLRDRKPESRMQDDSRIPNSEDLVHTSPAKAARQSEGGFSTAKAMMAAEARKAGKAGFNAKEYSSGSMFPDADSAFSGKPQRGGARPVASGLRKTQPAAAGGPRGAFVPPFAKKAMAAGDGAQEDGPPRSKSLEALAGPDGELPEALQKLDPNILELVCNEILDKRSGVEWDDIAGQHEAKSLVQELVVWPMLNPHLFTGARAPPKGLLLFGPPGTGKTLIGRAIASNIKATFFNISAGSLTSKWIGEGEKMVRALFAVASALQPAVIFMDEIDSVLSARKAEGEHEASRRLKTELLVQMEGVDPSGQDCRILLVGATNRPEELDEAARRRLPKQLYIPLPCEEARESMLLRQLGPGCGVRAQLPTTDIRKIVVRTAGYSGSDMRNLIQEASQGPVRDAVKQHGAGVADISEADLRPVVLKDFQMAAKAQRASVEPAEIVRYEQYDAKHGARYITPGSGATMDVEDEEW